MRASESALYTGHVMHQRMRPARHRLRYRLFSLLLDLDELEALDGQLRWFSLNRFNLFSLHERDYGDGGGLRKHVERQLLVAGLQVGGAIRLLTMPRILGYAFNPISVYFCHRLDGDLQAIVYEVNNTFGERHSYFIAVDADACRDATIMQSCAKSLHVSPFLGLDMRYGFRIDAPRADTPHLAIAVSASDSHGGVLIARFDAQRKPLSDAALAGAFFSHPLLTLKVIVAIHWEALRLWIKGVPLHSRPAAPPQPVHSIKPEDS
ncbi:DUF1365 domain-containing protein [Variovorax sp. J22R133]|uniref:DUF1365 domain-containing protein n=1 Tax=Variovorax brevis TaxID=3053503 RepID=UPI0025758F1A|nr:DUF1365 domain-containing protein [Variovorax sp. J22R133]MDM0111149.1 DUF1365 domain-containing protein [Variovorax sp. J22R133]